MKVQLILVCLLVEYASTTLESLMQIISINSKKYDMYGWEYVDLYEDDAQHIPLVEETPKFIQRMIKNNNNWNKPILKNNEFLSHLNASNLPWTYNNYLTTMNTLNRCVALSSVKKRIVVMAV
ncbi:unnamed protein product [Trichobilharzia regenti]|nr:unnamed protein product [Trichobilharzia regenti]